MRTFSSTAGAPSIRYARDMATPREEPLVVIGAGAAGMFAALAARGAIAADGSSRAPLPNAPTVLLVDGRGRPGAKILVSGGGRCNVTNARVRPTDFETDAPHALRAILAGFPPEAVRRFFESRGVALREEAQGKLFPASGDARTVLVALDTALSEAGVERAFGSAVTGVSRSDHALLVTLAGHDHEITAARVIVATGGLSLPKSGSTGAGYRLAQALGLDVLPQRPALTPLVLAADHPLDGLAGITLPAILTLAPRGTADEQAGGARFRPLARAAGSVLVTHRGLSGPAALDVSAACARSLATGDAVELIADFWALSNQRGESFGFSRVGKPPGACVPPDLAPTLTTFEPFQAEVLASAGSRGLGHVLAEALPQRLAERVLTIAALESQRLPKNLQAGEWRNLFRAVARMRLPLSGTSGYAKAEVTAGGVPLAALGRTTLEARAVPGVHFCGEVVNVTGRLGGFNFQWAWSSGVAAGRAAARVDPARD